MQLQYCQLSCTKVAFLSRVTPLSPRGVTCKWSEWSDMVATHGSFFHPLGHALNRLVKFSLELTPSGGRAQTPVLQGKKFGMSWTYAHKDLFLAHRKINMLWILMV